MLILCFASQSQRTKGRELGTTDVDGRITGRRREHFRQQLRVDQYDPAEPLPPQQKNAFFNDV